MDPDHAAARLRRRPVPGLRARLARVRPGRVRALRLTVGEHDYALAAGDSLYFAADVAHAYANTTGAPCTYYVAALIMRPRRAGAGPR